MRVLVCGGRDYKLAKFLYSVLDNLARHEVVDCIIEGDAPGADRMAGYWAKKNRVDLKIFQPNWEKDGRAAGPRRNQRMLEIGKPDLVIAFPRDSGKFGGGTLDMIQRAERAGVPVRRMLNPIPMPVDSPTKDS
jgi:hypothetical protein